MTIDNNTPKYEYRPSEICVVSGDAIGESFAGMMVPAIVIVVDHYSLKVMPFRASLPVKVPISAVTPYAEAVHGGKMNEWADEFHRRLASITNVHPLDENGGAS